MVDSYYSPRMRFGKHKGKLLTEIGDVGYLHWLLSLPDLDAGLRYSVTLEIERREAYQAEPTLNLPDLRPLADDWYRQLAREFHPDRGGSHEAMKGINRGRELLLEMLEAAT